MYQPKLYSQANWQQRNDAKRIIDEFADVLELCTDGNHSLMDVGCGTGDVLMDFIYPILSKSYSKIVGTDISPEMIQHSKRNYAEHDKVDFKVFDIETDAIPFEYYKQFNHVTSFYCLHWVRNQRQALKNIYDMLCNGGNCLLVFLCSVPVIDAYQNLAVDPRFCEYMKDVDKFVFPLQNHPTPWIVYSKLLKDIGFVDQHLEIRQKGFFYEGYESFRDHLTSINPFIKRMPLDKQEEYIKGFKEYWQKIGLCEELLDKNDHRYIMPYNLVVAYAKK